MLCRSKTLMTPRHIEERLSVGRTLDKGPGYVLQSEINAGRSENMAKGGEQWGDGVSK